MKIKVGYCSELDHTGSHYTRFTVLTTILPTNCLCIVCTEFLGHLSHSGDLLLWVGVRRRASSVVRRPLTSSSQELLGQS